MTTALQPFLPQEILVEILSKLPAKSLVRFKCVSKFFCSLVVDHPFADLHRNWSLTLPSRMSILIVYPILRRGTCSNWYYKINYSEENQGKLQANRLHYFDDDDCFREVYMSSSLNGLICFCRNSNDDIAIHNLSTRQHILLPASCRRVRRRRSRSRMMNAIGLLGFDSVSRRYKVLKSVQFCTHPGPGQGWHVSVKHWVFTLGVDESWREIHSSPYFHPYSCLNSYCASVYINGVIYSLNYLNNSLNKEGDRIVAFDFKVENFRAIPPPPSPLTTMRAGLVEVDGQLALVNLNWDEDDPGMEIWIMEVEEKESMVWKKQYVIHFPIQLERWFKKTNFFLATNHAGEIAVGGFSEEEYALLSIFSEACGTKIKPEESSNASFCFKLSCFLPRKSH
ncbi:F-box/kelch-repeat protein At4g19930-like [Ipomoea triloba]|uniref:F-box/kelch-repeat protein At4g19930-like n=1 Tax=Ipomoea triloba TaxID=35885 RepID=UPI00125E5523|nr:F-box/kelch-repeat protein At4g19930-like [Ipomoea triloba]